MIFDDAPSLPGFVAAQLPYARRMARLERGRDAGLRLHLVDHGALAGRPVLMVHGNPSWSFLWRKVIGELDGARYRCIAPDLLGLGLSDRLPAGEPQSLARQIDAMVELVEGLDLREVILVGQDWGGPVAAGVGARLPERVAGLVFANTAVIKPRRFRGTPFHRFARLPVVPRLLLADLGLTVLGMRLVQGEQGGIGPTETAAYLWPLRRRRDRYTALELARMVPADASHPTVAAMSPGSDFVQAFDGPSALVWGERDPVLGRALRRHVEAMPEAEVTRTTAGHFLQEEVPEALAAAIDRVDRRAVVAAASPVGAVQHQTQRS